jgi:hypothetical protein
MDRSNYLRYYAFNYPSTTVTLDKKLVGHGQYEQEKWVGFWHEVVEIQLQEKRLFCFVYLNQFLHLSSYNAYQGVR